MTTPSQYQSGLGYSGNKIPKGYSLGQMQNYDPQQMQTYQNQFQHVSPDSYLGKLAAGDQSEFAALEAPALRQLNEIQGNTASRFSGMGQGGRRSSGFQNTMSAQTNNFAEQLQAQRMNIRNQAIQSLMSMSNTLLGQSPYEQFMVKNQPKQNKWGGPLGAAVGGVGGFMLGGPAGAFQGASLGYGIGSGNGVDPKQDYSAFKDAGNKDWGYDFNNYFDPGI